MDHRVSSVTSERQLRKKLIAAGAVAGAAAIALLATRGARHRDLPVTYPPLDVPKPLAPDIWVVDSGPIHVAGLSLPLRMTVVRLPDGGLLLHSPVRHTPALAEALAPIGPVRHLVAPNIAHWTFLTGWQAAFPEAVTWAVPALRKRAPVRRSGVRIDLDLSDIAPDAWSGVIDQRIVRGRGFEEAGFFHKPSGTLILVDLIENLEPARLPPITSALMRATLATRETTALHVRAAVALGGEAARDAVAALVATAPTRVVFAHGTIFTEDAARRLRRAFAWLIG
ncbi:DUF4336 domain-containing protein [Sphingomonas sp. Y38-1Y]|uniref:DUF4336 domain-containing protein n=1 Tax=Sphingomonas sp. Y38-1Y TaxID=3078265 RepID=UPI0028E6E015|nr:DUF4336 domain-containing protein [Sphingomonas sp. Y38-1Y]